MVDVDVDDILEVRGAPARARATRRVWTWERGHKRVSMVEVLVDLVHSADLGRKGA